MFLAGQSQRNGAQFGSIDEDMTLVLLGVILEADGLLGYLR